jgi:hypothetical protein
VAKEYVIDIVVNDSGAVESLKGVDTTTANMESRLAAAKARVAELEAAFKSMGTSIEQPNRMLDQARANVAALEAQMGGLAKGVTDARSPIDDLGRSANTSADGLAKMEGMAIRIVERMAILYALRAGFQFVEGIFDASKKLEILSSDMDVSVEGVQRLQHIADDAYVPMNRLASAIDTMTKKLTTDDGGAARALDSVGLKISDVRNMRGEDAFDLIATSVGSVEDHVKRAGDEFAIFGTDKIDRVVHGYTDLKKGADSVNDMLTGPQVDALASAGKAWDRYWASVRGQAARTAATIAQGGQRGGVSGIATSLIGLTPYLGEHPEESTGLGFGEGGGIVTDVLRQIQLIFTGGPDRLSGVNKPLREDSGQAINETYYSRLSAGAAPGGTAAGLGSSDPAVRRAALASLEASAERETNTARTRMEVEREEAKVLHEIRTLEGGRLNDAEALLKMTSNMKAELESSQKAMKEFAAAATSELAARDSTQAARGYDPRGNAIALSNTPEIIRQRALDELARSSKQTPGVDTTFRKQQIEDDYVKNLEAATKAAAENLTVVVGLSTAERAATTSADNLSKSHAGAVQAGTAMTATFGQFTQVMAGAIPIINLQTGQNTQGTDPRVLGYMSQGYTQGEAMALASGSPNVNLGGPKLRSFDTGGPVTQDGPIMAHAGEFVVPKEGALMKSASGSSSPTIINVTIDAKGATFEDDRALDRMADRVSQRLGQRYGQGPRN